jgi:hypothetical protein
MCKDVKIERPSFKIDVPSRIDRPVPLTYTARPFHAPALCKKWPLAKVAFRREEQPEMKTITSEALE